MPEAVLEVTDIHKRYGGTVALNGVSLAVEAGEVFGLLGPNGAGKTTLLSIAAGLTRADGGTVKLFGHPFSRDTRELRHLVGIGTQDLSIYPDLTARENLRFFGKLYGLRGAALESRVDEMLAAVGLTDRANDRAGHFSGGMKRRLNLAVAVVHAPKLLFLDEPTTGVDPQSRNHIFEQVKALNAAGLTVIYTSHYMEEVQALCKRIAVLDNGTLRACDTLPHLLKRLDTTIRVTVTHAPADFADRLATIPGVKRVLKQPTPSPPLPEGKGEMSGPSPLAGEGVGASPTGEGSNACAPEAPPLTRLEDSPPSPARGEGKGSPPPPVRFVESLGRPTPPAPLPEGKGEKEGSRAGSASGSSMSDSPFPSGRGAGGVGSSRGVGRSTFELVVEVIGPVLARVASECTANSAELTSATTTEPTLERVFLHLTGRGLRD